MHCTFLWKVVLGKLFIFTRFLQHFAFWEIHCLMQYSFNVFHVFRRKMTLCAKVHIHLWFFFCSLKPSSIPNILMYSWANERWAQWVVWCVSFMKVVLVNSLALSNSCDLSYEINGRTFVAASAGSPEVFLYGKKWLNSLRDAVLVQCQWVFLFLITTLGALDRGQYHQFILIAKWR